MTIDAAPGSGKTTALREWCRGQPDRSILFLSYSKTMQEQQGHNMAELANVSVRTIHSVAYGVMGIRHYQVGAVQILCIGQRCVRPLLALQGEAVPNNVQRAFHYFQKRIGIM